LIELNKNVRWHFATAMIFSQRQCPVCSASDHRCAGIKILNCTVCIAFFCECRANQVGVPVTLS